jgi:hypothetical protein
MTSAADSGAVAAAVAAAPGGASVSRASSVGGVTVLASGGFAWPPPVITNGTNASLPCVQPVALGGAAAAGLAASATAALASPEGSGLTAGVLGAAASIAIMAIWYAHARVAAATAALDSERARRGAPPGAPPPPPGKPPHWSFFRLGEAGGSGGGGDDAGSGRAGSAITRARTKSDSATLENVDFQTKNPMRARTAWT